MNLLVALLLLIPIAAILYYGWGILTDIRKAWLYYKSGLAKSRIAILQKYQPYYIGLNSANKKRFEERVHWWIVHKQFIPRQMDKVTEEMKVLIAACAVQLTFGYERYYFRHFRRILLYPDAYYSEINKRYHRGEVNPQFGLIILSWKAFVTGYIEHDSGRNLGLHEMAHAIKLESFIAQNHEPLIDAAAWQRWYKEADNYMSKGDESGFFRSYAYTNEHEFFAVAVENFFERPQEFKQIKAQLYNCLVTLLKQDPLHLINRY